MQLTKIIGSTELGWHEVASLTPEALMRFASVPDVHFLSVSPGCVCDAPGTLVGYAKNVECPFLMRDAHAVLSMLRPGYVEVQSVKHKANNRIK